MRQVYLFFFGIFISFILLGCASTKPVQKAENTILSHPAYDSSQDKLAQVALAPKRCPIKNPIAIAFYTKGKAPSHPYKVIAKESISKFNAGGIKRQEAIIHDVLRELAASVGGDAVINITHSDKKISAEIVKFTV